jgi:hypothetical protein
MRPKNVCRECSIVPVEKPGGVIYETNAEWLALARQHSKTMTIRQVKILYGAIAPARVIEIETLSGKKSTIHAADLALAGSLIWDCIGLARTPAGREALEAAHALVCAAANGTVETKFI